VAPFEELNHEFDFHYLFHLSKAEEGCSHTNRPRHYWNDFDTAQEVIGEIKPDRIIFMSLSGLRPIALNMAARRRAIPTFILQHGYFQSLENYLSPPTGSSKEVSETKAGAQVSLPQTFSRCETEKQHDFVDRAFIEMAQRDGVTYMPVWNLICLDHCLGTDQNRALYSDSGRLSLFGTKRFLGPALKPRFRSRDISMKDN